MVINEIESNIVDYLFEISPLILNRFREVQRITQKVDGSIVTETDKEVEILLRKRFENLLPNAYFLGEESSEMTPEKYRAIFNNQFIWAIDPIDGTTNFASRIPTFGVSVGLLEKTLEGHKPIVGALLFPATNEIIYTKNGKSIFEFTDQQEPIVLERPVSPKEKKLVMLPDSFYKAFDFNYILPGVEPRLICCAAANMGYVVTGRSIGTITSAHLWDFAGGLAIAHNLGMNFRSYQTGKVKESFGVDDFITGDPKKDWKTKDLYILSTAENYSVIEQSMKKK